MVQVVSSPKCSAGEILEMLGVGQKEKLEMAKNIGTKVFQLFPKEFIHGDYFGLTSSDMK